MMPLIHELTFSDVDAVPLAQLVRDLSRVCPGIADRLTYALTRLGLCVSTLGASVRFDTRVEKSKSKVVKILNEAMSHV